MRATIPTTVALALLVFICAAPPLVAQTQLRIHVVGAGGGTTAAGTSGARLTVGQPAIGIAGAGASVAELGFWHQFLGLGPVGIPSDTPILNYHLYQNVPNPIVRSATLRFSLATEERVQLDLFDLQGRRVARLVNKTYPAGDHSLAYRAEDLPGGVYLLLLQAGSYRASRHLVLVK